MTEQPTLQAVIVHAMKDAAFRQQLRANPRAILERELGITLPQEATVQVLEDTPTAYHVVIPMQAQTETSRELSDEELGAIAGGSSGVYCGGSFTYYPWRCA